MKAPRAAFPLLLAARKTVLVRLETPFCSWRSKDHPAQRPTDNSRLPFSPLHDIAQHAS